MYGLPHGLWMITVLLIIVLPVYGTPPDVFTADFYPLGQSDSTFIFLLTTGSNLGSHYLWQTRWFLFELSPESTEYSWIDLGSLTEAPDDFGGNVYQIPDSSPGFVQTLKSIGLYSVSPFAVSPETLHYELNDSGLVLASDAGSFALSSTLFLDPGYLAWQGTDQEIYFTSETGRFIRVSEYPLELLRFFPWETERIVLAVDHEMVFREKRILVVTIPDEIAPFEVVAIFDQDEYETAVNEIHD